MPCFVSLGGYPCSTNHVEINDVCVGLYNAELLVGPGRKCALRELSLTNKNNIIMTVLILWIIAAAGEEYRKYLNDITYYLLSLTFTTLCEMMGTLLCRSWIYVAERGFHLFLPRERIRVCSRGCNQRSPRRKDLSTFSRAICLTLYQNWKYIKHWAENKEVEPTRSCGKVALIEKE